MAKRDVFAEMLEGMEALRYEREGKMTLRTHQVTKKAPVTVSAAEVRRVRNKLEMSQTLFANAMRANKRTYERWEKEGIQGPQATLLKLIGKHPELIKEIEAM